jgi:osmotically-inducible protein OsmY
MNLMSPAVRRNPVPALVFALMLSLTGCAGRESAGEFIDDAAVTTKVKAAFVADKTVSALNISVESDKGVVTLGGVAKTPEEKRHAEQIARQIAGVRAVRNNIVVR